MVIALTSLSIHPSQYNLPRVSVRGGLTQTLTANKPTHPSLANHSSQSSLPCHTFHSIPYMLTCQSSEHSQSIQSCKTSPPCQTCHSNRAIQSNQSTQSSKNSHNTHSRHSSIITSNKATQSIQSSYLFRLVLPALHFVLFILPSISRAVAIIYLNYTGCRGSLLTSTSCADWMTRLTRMTTDCLHRLVWQDRAGGPGWRGCIARLF